MPLKSESEFEPSLTASRQAALPVRAANCFLPAALRCTGPQVDYDAIEQYARTAFERAQRVGLGTIVFGSGGARNVPDGFSHEAALEQFVDVCLLIAPHAQAHGVTVVIEPLNRGECNFINSLAEGARVVERCDHPHIRLLADFYHMLREDEPPSEIARFAPLLAHCHVAEKAERTPPGVAGDNFVPFLQALEEGAYSGRLAIESGWRDVPAQAPDAFRVLRKQSAQANSQHKLTRTT